MYTTPSNSQNGTDFHFYVSNFVPPPIQLLPHSRNEGAIIVYLARGIPEQNALRHLFTSDSASSTPDWISDSFCFFFSAEIPPNQQNNQQKLGPPNGIKMGNQIKQGKLAYLHRGRGRPRPRSIAYRSPRTPRSWLLLVARLDLRTGSG